MSIHCAKCKASKGSLETRIEAPDITTKRLIVRCVLCGWSVSKDLTVEPDKPQRQEPAPAAKPAAPRTEKQQTATKVNQTWAPCQVLGCRGQFMPARERSGWPLCPTHRKRMFNWRALRPDGPAPLIETAPGQWDENPELRRHRRTQAAQESAAAKPIEQEVENMATPSTQPEQKTCADCGQAKKIQGRGLCKSCYQRHSRAGSLEQFPSTRRYLKDQPVRQPPDPESEPVNPHQPQAKGEIERAIAQTAKAAEVVEVELDFAPEDFGLLESLRVLASKERRSLEQQILVILDHHLGGTPC